MSIDDFIDKNKADNQENSEKNELSEVAVEMTLKYFEKKKRDYEEYCRNQTLKNVVASFDLK